MPAPALKTITGTFTGPDGAGISCQVKAVLSQPCTVPGTQEVVEKAARVNSDPTTGAFSLPLYANADLTPANSYYTITAIGNVDGVAVVGTWVVVVPQTAGPFEVSNILVSTPPVASPPGALDSQVVHLALPETISGVKSGPFRDWGGGVFNVQSASNPSGAAVGDGVTDDTVAIQGAINAALAVRGTVLFPPPSVTYKVTDTLTIGTTGQNYCNLLGVPKDESNKLILWAGADSKPVFSTRGWRLSWADSITVKIPNTSSAVEVWDVDTAAAATSSTGLQFRNCNVFIVSGGAGTGCYAWRVGKSGLTNDISAVSWYDCQVYGAGDNTKNHIGWSIEQANAIGFRWFGGLGYFLSSMVKMVLGDDFNVHGLSGTHNAKDFLVNTNLTNLSIYGGRFELGDKFIDVEHDTNVTQNILVSGAKIYNYTPGGGQLIRILGVPNLVLDDCMIVNRGGADYTSNLIWHYCDGVGTGVTRVRGGVIQAPYPFHTINAGSTAKFRIRCESVTRCDNLQVYSALMGADQSNALTYGATVNTDANLSDYFTLNVTNGTAFTIANPTNAFAGQTLTYDIKNSSGGAHGVVTWGSAFLNGGAGTVGTGAFTGIANGDRRSITFVYDGANWIERARASGLPESAVTNLTADLAAKATDSLVVHLAGAETVTGVKDHPNGSTANLTADVVGLSVKASSSQTQNLQEWKDNGNNVKARIGATGNMISTGVIVATGRMYCGTVTTLTDAANIATDALTANAFKVTLTASRNMSAPTNPIAGQRCVWTIVQNGTGGWALTWDVVFKLIWSDTGNTLNKRSSIACVYDGTNWNQDGAQTPYV